MRDAFIFAPSEFSLQNFWTAATESGLTAVNYGDLISVGTGDESVDIQEMINLDEYFEEEQWAATKSCGPSPRFYQLRFRDPRCAAQLILAAIPRRQDFVLDNDHGLLLPIDRFAEAYLKHSDWDWSMAKRSPDYPPVNPQ